MPNTIPTASCKLTKMDSLPGRPANFKVLYSVTGYCRVDGLPKPGERFHMSPTEGEFKGGFFTTSRVVRIISRIEQTIRFETLNSVYKLTFEDTP